MRSIRYRLRTEDLAWRVLEGEGVLVDLARRRILACNASATTLVAALLAGATEAELVHALCEAYDVEAERARADARELLAELPVAPVTSAGSLARPRRGARAGETVATVTATPTKSVYVRPKVDSNELFYAAAGCGKTSPRVANCQRVRRNS